MTKTPRRRKEEPPPLDELDLFLDDWLALTPRERLARSWAMRERLPDPQAVHDAKLFPKPEDETLPHAPIGRRRSR